MANIVLSHDGRRSKARFVDRGEHLGGAEAGELGRATFPGAGMRHRGFNLNSGAEK